MIIPINLTPPSLRLPNTLDPVLAKLGSNEVVLIELQGWLDVVEGEKDNGFIGNLTIENVCIMSMCFLCVPNIILQDKPVLKIGHHHLEGKIVSLSKPLAVLARGGIDEDEYGGESSTRYDVMTIIKRKVLFAKRPVPMVNLKRT